MFIKCRLIVGREGKKIREGEKKQEKKKKEEYTRNRLTNIFTLGLQ